MLAPDCLICDLVKSLNNAYQRASWDRKAMRKTADIHPGLRGTPFAKALEARCAYAAMSLFMASKHQHNESVRRE